MELSIDIQNALAVQTGKTVQIGKLQQQYDNVYVLAPADAPDPVELINGQVINFQQFDIWACHSNLKTALQMAQDARAFFACLPCVQQKVSSPAYTISQSRVIGGISAPQETVERKQMVKFTVQITYLLAC